MLRCQNIKSVRGEDLKMCDPNHFHLSRDMEWTNGLVKEQKTTDEDIGVFLSSKSAGVE